tara:strand:- start:85 stop:573 length:489 start_codon:yes stop_codon:yes gene_type:complete
MTSYKVTSYNINIGEEKEDFSRSESQESIGVGGPCCHFTEACGFVCSNFKDKMSSDLLMGTKPSSLRILPEDNIGKHTTIFMTLSDDEKKECVQSDPRFGMFSLFKYNLKKGYLKKKLTKGNVYCFNIFSLFFALPILCFITQWMMYVGLMIHQTKNYNGEY